MKRIVLIGATSAMAEHCARIWADQAPADFVLVGRDPERLKRVATDLQIRQPESQFKLVKTDFLDTASIGDTVTTITNEKPVDIALIAHGSLPDQDVCQTDLAACKQALDINATSPALFAEAFAQAMAKTGNGNIVIIGSVAGDRGRKSNYSYGAAKGMVERYAEGLQHRFAGTNIKVTLVKPGPTDTPMTAHLKANGVALASVESVAEQIVKGVAAGRPIIYAPAKWWLIMNIIRRLPRFVFHKLNI